MGRQKINDKRRWQDSMTKYNSCYRDIFSGWAKVLFEQKLNSRKQIKMFTDFSQLNIC